MIETLKAILGIIILIGVIPAYFWYQSARRNMFK